MRVPEYRIAITLEIQWTDPARSGYSLSATVARSGTGHSEVVPQTQPPCEYLRQRLEEEVERLESQMQAALSDAPEEPVDMVATAKTLCGVAP